jgi:hypothetical protein
MRSAGYVSRSRRRRNAYKSLVGKPKGNRLFGRLGGRKEDNTEIDIE